MPASPAAGGDTKELAWLWAPAHGSPHHRPHTTVLRVHSQKQLPSSKPSPAEENWSCFTSGGRTEAKSCSCQSQGTAGARDRQHLLTSLPCAFRPRTSGPTSALSVPTQQHLPRARSIFSAQDTDSTPRVIGGHRHEPGGAGHGPSSLWGI